MPTSTSSVVYLLLALLFFWNSPAQADENEVWWETAQAEADREGYRLLDSKGLRNLFDSGVKPLLIDARADYEFTAGHIVGANNIEFDLGDRISLPEAKRAAFMKLAGPDPQRVLVIYCRSFR